MKDENQEIQMDIEVATEEPIAESPEEGQKEPENAANVQSTLQLIKESASEDDEAVSGTLTLKQIVGGDYLFSLVRHHVWLIMLIVLITTIYVGVRYQCEQDVLEINQLEKDLVDAKFKSLASSSNLTELCRQSNVLRVLHENQDTLLQLSDQPPYIIEVPEE